MLTPVVTERIRQRTWVLTLLVVAAVTQLFPGALYTEPALLVTAYFLGVASQGIKIVVDTLVQTHVDDVFRGRVFSLYDVIFNVAFVAAAVVAALVLPLDGKSYAVLVSVTVGYLVTAVWYARVTRRRLTRRPAARRTRSFAKPRLPDTRVSGCLEVTIFVSSLPTLPGAVIEADLPRSDLVRCRASRPSRPVAGSGAIAHPGRGGRRGTTSVTLDRPATLSRTTSHAYGVRDGIHGERQREPTTDSSGLAASCSDIGPWSRRSSSRKR